MTDTEIILTKCQILLSKCKKFDFGWGSAHDPAGELYSALPDLAGFGGPTSKGKEREIGREGREREKEGKKGRGKQPSPDIELAMGMQYQTTKAYSRS